MCNPTVAAHNFHYVKLGLEDARSQPRAAQNLRPPDVNLPRPVEVEVGLRDCAETPEPRDETAGGRRSETHSSRVAA